MASIITRVLDRVTPWNRGGELQRRQEKRRRDEEEAQRRAMNFAGSKTYNRPQRQPDPQGQELDQPLNPQKPVNIFETLNKDLTLGQREIAPVTVKPDQNTRVDTPPQPGAVVEPDTPEKIINRGLDAGKSWEQIAKENNYNVEGVRKYSESTRPNYGINVKRPEPQTFAEKLRDQIDANTEADKFRRQEGNRIKGENKPINLVNPGNIVSRAPVVGTVTKMVNTAGVQGPQVVLTAAQQFATREQAAANANYQEALKTGDKKRIIEAEVRARDAAIRVREVNKDIEKIDDNFKKNKGGLFNAGTLYDEEASQRGDIKTGLKDIALPAGVAAADIYTLGKGNLISEGLKQGGTSALRTQAPNIVKAGAGNFASGAGSTISDGGNAEQAVKSGLINSVLGLVPDIFLPMAFNSVKAKLPNIFRRGGPGVADIASNADEAVASAGAEGANIAARPRPIPVAENIPVRIPEGSLDPVQVPVRRGPSLAQPIKELEGDFTLPTIEKLKEIRVADARKAAEEFNSSARPDMSIEGVTPRQAERPFALDPTEIVTQQSKVIDDYATMLREVGEGNGVDILPDGRRVSNNFRPGDTKGKAMSKTAWREEAARQLQAGNAEPSIQSAFDEAADPEVQALLNKGERPDVPEGTPIKVKQTNSIPVVDNTNMPQGLPEKPGTVRPTETAAPTNTKSEAVANTPTVKTPAQLPTEVQRVLDNPKQFSKRQVAAARNQRKLARQMAKTQEDTALAMERINASSPNRVRVEGQSEGFAPTGEFRKGKRGNVSESASRATEAQAGAKEMANRSVDDLLDEISAKETLTPGDRRRITAAKENLMQADPEGFRASEKYKVLDTLEKSSRSDLGRGLALIPRTIRKTADSEALAARWERKIGNVLDDPSKLSDAQWKEVQSANAVFTNARDTAGALEEQFRRTGTEADYKAWEKAYMAARDADVSAKMTEVKIAQQVLKGEKGANVTKLIDSLKKEADVNTMDYTSAAMLSGTGTGFRNTFGTEVMGLENRLFANTRAKITNKLFKENVGGFDRAGGRFGRKMGVGKWVDDIKRRAAVGGKNPLEWAKNWSTTINSAGESSLQSQVYSRLAKYYKNQFDAEGLSGKQLDLRMRHAMITDPDNMSDLYLDAAMKSSGLTGLFEKGQTIEKAVTDYVGRNTDSKLAQGASKLVMRMAVGFPTATGNFLYQSGKRLTFGLPSWIETGAKLAKGDKAAAAMAFERGLKEAGSGAAMLGFGAAMGSAGLISGPYPSDPDERERWAREGISEHSIKIGGAWYPIPQGAGMLGLPIMVGAAIGAEGDSNDSLKKLFEPKSLAKLLPTDQIQGFLNTLSGDESPQALKNMIASSVRAVTPVGALLNQIAKSFDPTKNDTTQHGLWNNVLDQVISGIPGVNNMVDIADKTTEEGVPIKNPNALQLAVGASSAAQGAGEQLTAEKNQKIESTVDELDKYGLLDNPDLDGILKESGLDAYNKLKSGKKLDESDVKALKEGLVKGVSSKGEDTAYLERGQYETNLAVLNLKRDMMAADPSVKPSSLKDIDVAIKRGEIYKKDRIPYELISDYQSIGVEEWRKMGDPEADEYDPEMYQKLFEIDDKMTKAGVSYKKGALDKPKYTAKQSGGRGGRGGGGGSKRIDTDFGTLREGKYAPKVQEYSGIDAKAGNVPIIRRVRPNIVHKISSSG